MSLSLASSLIKSSLKKKVAHAVGRTKATKIEKVINIGLLLVAPVVLLITFVINKTKKAQNVGTTTKTTSKDSVGIRNNNWLNIRKNDAVNWKGEKSSTNAFELFETVELGLRAAMKQMYTNYAKHGCNTVAKMVNRWAPPTENNTPVYVTNVAARMGISPNQTINYDKSTIFKMVSAMAKQEVGKSPSQAQLEKAWELL